MDLFIYSIYVYTHTYIGILFTVRLKSSKLLADRQAFGNGNIAQ